MKRKRPSSLVLALPSPDSRQYEEKLGNSPAQLPDAAPCSIHSQQDFAQLLARYKRAGFEAFEHWSQAHYANR